MDRSPPQIITPTIIHSNCLWTTLAGAYSLTERREKKELKSVPNMRLKFLVAISIRMHTSLACMPNFPFKRAAWSCCSRTCIRCHVAKRRLPQPHHACHKYILYACMQPRTCAQFMHVLLSLSFLCYRFFFNFFFIAHQTKLQIVRCHHRNMMITKRWISSHAYLLHETWCDLWSQHSLHTHTAF